MGDDLYTILEICGILIAAFWLIGFVMLLVAVKKARREFRAKGFLRTPSGTRWFRFLMYRQYDVFDDPGIRFFFGIAHFCLMGMIIAVIAVVVLFGSEWVLKGMYGFPVNGLPRVTLPK